MVARKRRGMIDLPRFHRAQAEPLAEADLTPTAIDLPAREVIEAGVSKFFEMANLYWPAKGGVISFDPRNKAQLRMALGLVYMAMKEIDDAD